MTTPFQADTHQYSNLQEAAKGLLGESVRIMSQSGIDYVVIGGWIPFLFYSKYYPHPGSFDVDMLLNAEKTTVDQMDKAVESFTANGYMFSAKNKFQLHKPLNVNGEFIIFHVDFLHRRYAPDQEEGRFLNWNRATSISGPGTDIIFTDNERSTQNLDFIFPDGSTQTVSVTFASEIGFISAKGRALQVSKRTRDSYDIFLIITQSKDYDLLLRKGHEYYHSNNLFKKSIDNIYEFFKEGNEEGNTGTKNTIKYLDDYKDKIKYLPEDLENFILHKVGGYIEKIRIQ